MNEDKIVPITFDLRQSELERLGELAKEHDRTTHEILRMAFRLGIAQHFETYVKTEDFGGASTWTV